MRVMGSAPCFNALLNCLFRVSSSCKATCVFLASLYVVANIVFKYEPPIFKNTNTLEATSNFQYFVGFAYIMLQ